MKNGSQFPIFTFSFFHFALTSGDQWDSPPDRRWTNCEAGREPTTSPNLTHERFV